MQCFVLFRDFCVFRGSIAVSRINGNEHGVPHVHVLFKDGSRVSVAIETRMVLSGNVTPAKRLMPALADIKANERKCLDEYRRLNP